MKEKYIFFTLMCIALIMLLGSKVGKKTKDVLDTEELAIEKKLKRAAQVQPFAPGKIDMDQVQSLVAFSYYEEMLKRSPFFKVVSKVTEEGKSGTQVFPVEEKTPYFRYKGKIASPERLMVLIEQTRSGEVFMVSKGDAVDGYKVLDILNTEVILSKQGEENIVLKTVERP